MLKNELTVLYTIKPIEFVLPKDHLGRFSLLKSIHAIEFRVVETDEVVNGRQIELLSIVFRGLYQLNRLLLIIKDGKVDLNFVLSIAWLEKSLKFWKMNQNWKEDQNLKTDGNQNENFE